jgi:ABC-2 type transport system ATP-binding protein
VDTPWLELVDLQKRYGRAVAVDGVSLAVNRGEIFGLLGPNGAGKTTLLSMLAGLIAPDGGSINLAGKPTLAADRRRVGIGTQDLALYPDLSARENLHFFGRLYGMNGPLLARRADELLVAVGLQDRADNRAGTYSGGMKRRLNLAVAVVHGPELLLLDEPTTGVDPQSRYLIYDTVRALNEAGMTVIYTSHYMDEVQALCARIAILDAGKVRACDTLPNLLATLETTLKLTAPGLPGGFVEAAAALPGVTQASPTATGLSLRTANAGPLLPKLAELARMHAVAFERIETDEPNLEKVFLHLTGRGLRD